MIEGRVRNRLFYVCVFSFFLSRMDLVACVGVFLYVLKSLQFFVCLMLDSRYHLLFIIN